MKFQCDSQVIHESASVSVAAYLTNLVERFDNILKIDCWQNDPSGILVIREDILFSLLQKRGATTSQISAFKLQIARCRSAFPSLSSDKRWFVHGHIGMQAVWSAIGKMALLSGCSDQEAERIANGFNEEKLRNFSDLWARDIQQGRTSSLEGLWKWCVSSMTP